MTSFDIQAAIRGALGGALLLGSQGMALAQPERPPAAVGKIPPPAGMTVAPVASKEPPKEWTG